MKIIKRTADNVVLYAGETLTLTATHATNDDWIDRSTNSLNAVLVFDVTLPDEWQGGEYFVDGADWTLTEQGVTARANKIRFVPQFVTMRQARLALLAAEKLSSVNSAIAGMTGPAGDAARIEWEFSIEVKRQQPLVLSLGKALSMSSLQLDDLFVAAAAL